MILIYFAIQVLLKSNLRIGKLHIEKTSNKTEGKERKNMLMDISRVTAVNAILIALMASVLIFSFYLSLVGEVEFVF